MCAGCVRQSFLSQTDTFPAVADPTSAPKGWGTAKLRLFDKQTVRGGFALTPFVRAWYRPGTSAR